MPNLRCLISNLKSKIINFRLSTSDLRSPILVWLMVMVLAAAYAMRVRHLSVSDLTFDEAVSAFISAKPYPEMIRYLLGAFRDLPPAYYAFLRAWEFVAGRSEFALRYPSVFFGVLGIALIYRLGRRGLGTGPGWIAALLLTFQPFHVYYSQDARPYTLMPVEAMLMIYCFDRLCHDRRLRWWLAFSVVGVVSVLTHQGMAFMIVALCVYLLLHARAHRQMLVPWFGGLALVGLAMAIWVLSSRMARLARRVLMGFSWQRFLERLPIAQGMLRDVVFNINWRPPPEWLTLIAVLVVCGVLIAILRHRWRTLHPGGAWLLPAWLFIPTLILILVPEMLEARYNAAIVPAYCLLLALVVVWLWQHKYTRPLAPIVLGLLLYMQITPLAAKWDWIKSDYGHIVGYLRRQARPGDSVIFNGPWQIYQLFYYPAPKMPTYWLPPSAPQGLDPKQARPELEKALATSKRIWLLPAAVSDVDPKRFVAGWLNEHAYLTSEYKELTLYTVSNSSGAPTPLDPPVTWNGTVQLSSFRWVQNQAVPGEPLLLDLNWQVLATPQRDLDLSIQLADRDGGVWYSAQIAPGLYYAPPSKWRAGERHTTRVGIPIPFGAPPGAFDLRVGIMLLRPDNGGDYVTLPGATVLPCSKTNVCAEPFVGEDYTPLSARYGDRLDLVGYQLGGAEFFQGRFASIMLYWRPERALADDVKERIALVDRAGRVVAQVEEPAVATWFPSSRWTPGQMWLDPNAMFIPPRVPPGDYVFRVSLFMSDGRTLPVTVGGTSKDWLDVGHVRISARERQFRAGPISHPLAVTFGDKVRLLGYDIKQVSNGEVTLILHWQAMREMEEGYTVFRHVIGPDGRLVGQKDSWPRDGDYPTSFWMRGEVVKDEAVIPISADAGSGAYRIEFGLYLAPDGPRLAAIANGARLKDDIVAVPVSVER